MNSELAVLGSGKVFRVDLDGFIKLLVDHVGGLPGERRASVLASDRLKAPISSSVQCGDRSWGLSWLLFFNALCFSAKLGLNSHIIWLYL